MKRSEMQKNLEGMLAGAATAWVLNQMDAAGMPWDPEEPTPAAEDFSKSFDGRDWARAFVENVRKSPWTATDEETMLAWFSNALMRGFDEAVNLHPTREPIAEPAPEPEWPEEIAWGGWKIGLYETNPKGGGMMRFLNESDYREVVRRWRECARAEGRAQEDAEAIRYLTSACEKSAARAKKFQAEAADLRTVARELLRDALGKKFSAEPRLLEIGLLVQGERGVSLSPLAQSILAGKESGD